MRFHSSPRHFAHALAVASMCLALAACQAPEENNIHAMDVISERGYTNVTTTGWEWAKCGKDDAFALGFTADAPNGSRVRGLACNDAGRGWSVDVTDVGAPVTRVPTGQS